MPGHRVAVRTAALPAAVLAACLAAGCSLLGPVPDQGGPRAAPSSATARAGARPSPIAGGTPSAVARSAKPPPRRLPTGVREVTLNRGGDRPLPTTVWYPTGGTGPFPLVYFSHGLTAAPTDYATMLRAWAQAGFVVAAAAYPHTSTGVPDYDPADVLEQPADASYVITEVLALGAQPGDPLRGRVDPGRVAAAGHSAGGVTTLAMFGPQRDTRLDAGVVLAGRQLLPGAFTGPAAPMLFVHGRLDRSVPYADGLAAYGRVPWPKAMLALERGGHVVTGRDLTLVTAATTDFLRWALYDDATARDRLAADAARGGRATLTGGF